MDHQTEERTRRAAANLAAWHTTHLHALGHHPDLRDGLWTCDLPEPTLYHSAITLAPMTRRTRRRVRDHVRAGRDGYVSVCDTFTDLPGERMGLRETQTADWWWRAPAPSVDPGTAPGTDRTAVTTPADLRAVVGVAVTAFGSPPPTHPDLVHHPDVLRDPTSIVRCARVDGEIVAVAMAQATDVLGVYGVATRPDHRGRGLASALVADLLAAHPDLPAALQPSALAVPLYRRLGFTLLRPARHLRPW